MFVVGKESEAVTVCQFDLKYGFIPVKLVNKGDRSVTLQGAVIYNPANGENSLQIGSILGITAGVAGVIVVGVGIFLIVYCCFCKKKQPKVEANVHVDEKDTKNPIDELDKKENKINVGASEKNDKKEQSKKAVDPKIDNEIDFEF
uniref:Uncharacterized protein n=1 Tax=Panagrolaimus sp. JU765 TaxID=591449 RepID=A0AC34RDT8_9BILA